MNISGLILVLLAAGLAACAPVEMADPAPAAAPVATVNKMADDRLPNISEWKKIVPSWFAAVPPFRVIGPETGGIYYVGTEGLGMYFIPTDAGHIVLDGGMPGHGQYVANAISALGYDPADIKILLNSHAHLDHSGGLAELKALSGAQLIASEGDRSALEGGFYLGSESNKTYNAPPVKVDLSFSDDFTVEHGGVTITAHITPGHSRGCTSWTMNVEQDGKVHEVLFFCSATTAANRLVGPPQYEGIVDDYRKTFALTKDWKPDVFLANHPVFFGLKAKRAEQQAGNFLAFVGKEDFPRFIAKMAVDFEVELQDQRLKQSAVANK